MTRPDSEAGFTLTELMVAMALLIVVLSATLGAFDSFGRANARNVALNDMQESARLTLDRLSTELRNVGSAPGQASGIERAQPLDLVFDSVDPTGGGSGAQSIRRVRYCLDQSNPTDGRLWRQTMPWSLGVPSTSSCPHPAFGSQQQVARGVVNGAIVRNGGTPPIFTFDTDIPGQMTSMGADLYIDTDIARPPAEARLQTGVRIRNRNRAPVADFAFLTQGNGSVKLNAGASSDPDGQALKFYWYCDGVPCPAWVFGATPPAYVTTPGQHTFGLRVEDPGGITDPAAGTQPFTKAVNVL